MSIRSSILQGKRSKMIKNLKKEPSISVTKKMFITVCYYYLAQGTSEPPPPSLSRMSYTVKKVSTKLQSWQQKCPEIIKNNAKTSPASVSTHNCITVDVVHLGA